MKGNTMNKQDAIGVMGFLGKEKAHPRKDESFISTGICLVSSGKTIAKWNERRDGIILPDFSDPSLSNLDKRRRELVIELAGKRGLSVRCVG